MLRRTKSINQSCMFTNDTFVQRRQTESSVYGYRFDIRLFTLKSIPYVVQQALKNSSLDWKTILLLVFLAIFLKLYVIDSIIIVNNHFRGPKNFTVLKIPARKFLNIKSNAKSLTSAIWANVEDFYFRIVTTYFNDQQNDSWQTSVSHIFLFWKQFWGSLKQNHIIFIIVLYKNLFAIYSNVQISLYNDKIQRFFFNLFIKQV